MRFRNIRKTMDNLKMEINYLLNKCNKFLKKLIPVLISEIKYYQKLKI